jgi:hypothetical protein
MSTIAVVGLLFAVCAIAISLPIGLLYRASNSATTSASMSFFSFFSELFDYPFLPAGSTTSSTSTTSTSMLLL